LDHDDVLQAVWPTIQAMAQAGNLEVRSCEVTERKLYVKCSFPQVRAEVKSVGEEVEAGFCLGNSETGDGSVVVNPFITVLSCTNGMVRSKQGIRKYHVGRRTELTGDAASELYRPETVEADNKALLMKVGDVVAACADEEKFRGIVAEMDRAAGVEIQGDPQDVVELVGKRFSLTETERRSTLTELIRYNDTYGRQSLFSVAQAVTRMAHDESGILDYDRATDLETVGSVILTMPKRELEPVVVR
jgi:hypothetical protein